MIYVTPGGRIIDEYVKGSSNFSDSTTLHKMTVPTGKRWWVYAICVNRDANATLTIRLYNSTPEVIAEFCSDAAATGRTMHPNTDKAELIMGTPFPLKAGDIINFSFGAAQGASGQINIIALEVDE